MITDNSSIDLSLTNIWRAWAAFRRGKKPSREIMAFEAELETGLLRLCADVNTGRYQHGPYGHRIVNEKKRRDIAVAGVRDRVVHRLLYDYLVPLTDSRLDYDVWSCRKNKGLHQALLRTKQLTTKHSQTWVLRADIFKFFDNVNHQTLRECLTRCISETKALDLLDKVIESYSSQLDRQTGIPIGNLTSQIFANIYLNEFDRFVRHQIKPLGYVRYGDDFVIFEGTKAQVKAIQELVSVWLSVNLALQLNSKNNLVFPAKRGIKFLGHQIYPFSPLAIDRQMTKKVNKQVNIKNMSSYKALHLTRKQTKRLPWLLLNNKL